MSKKIYGLETPIKETSDRKDINEFPVPMYPILEKKAHKEPNLEVEEAGDYYDSKNGSAKQIGKTKWGQPILKR
jgi:hypothetical protein